MASGSLFSGAFLFFFWPGGGSASDPRGEGFDGPGRLAAACPVCGEAAPIGNRWRPRPGDAVPAGGGGALVEQ